MKDMNSLKDQLSKQTSILGSSFADSQKALLGMESRVRSFSQQSPLGNGDVLDRSNSSIEASKCRQ